MEQIEYTRTVVPSSMRSPFWKYFGFPSDNGNNILTRQKVVCTLCNTAIAYNKNTSNLRTHLIARHSSAFQTLLANKQSSEEREVCESHRKKAEEAKCFEVIQQKKDGEICAPATPVLPLEQEVELGSECFDDRMDAACEIEDFEDCGHLDRSLDCITTARTNQQSLEFMLADMIQADLLPLDLLQGNGFCIFSQQMSGLALKNETVQRVTSLLKQHIDDAQKLFTSKVHKLSKTCPYSLSMERYDNSDGLTILNIYFNFLNEDHNQLDSILYHSGIVMGNDSTILNALNDINLKNCIGIVVNDLASVEGFIAEFAENNEMVLIECLTSTLERCLNQVFQLPFVAQSFEKLCRIVQHQKLPSSTAPTLILRCSWSKLNYLAFIYEHFADIKSDSYLNLIPIYEYVKPLKMALDIISDEKLPLCTLTRPLVVKLFEQHFGDLPANQTLVQIQNILHSELRERYCLSELQVANESPNSSNCMGIKQSSFLSEATYFDARFHHEFASTYAPFNFVYLKTKVQQRFKDILDIHSVTPCNVVTTQDSVCTNTRKSSLKTFLNYSESHLSSKAESPTSRTNFDVEFERYHIDAPIDLDQNAIIWWEEHAQIYSELCKVALYYLTVPCCCVLRLYNLEAEQRWRKLDRRKQLNQYCNIERHLWYLHYNKQK